MSCILFAKRNLDLKSQLHSEILWLICQVRQLPIDDTLTCNLFSCVIGIHKLYDSHYNFWVTGIGKNDGVVVRALASHQCSLDSNVVLLLYDYMLFLFSFLYTTLFPIFSGAAERVEMVIDDVVVEVSKHRGIGRMYLTNFR